MPAHHKLEEFAEAERIQHILNPSSNVGEDEAEEQRITYVALARAENRLFIFVPELTEDNEVGLVRIGVEIERLET